MPILIFAPQQDIVSSFLTGTVVITVSIGLITLLAIVRDRILFGKSYVAARAKAETICSWEYSAAEWGKYAPEFELSKNPKGAAIVRITLLDLWFTDQNGTIRKPIASKVMMATGYRCTGNLLKIRIRSHLSSARNDYYNYKDYSIPVPDGKNSEAQKAVESFAGYLASHPKKLDWVTPHNTLTGLFGEIDF